MRVAVITALAGMLAGCTGNMVDNPLAWMGGCWSDGSTVERWTVAEGGYLFGSSVLLQDGEVRFFEQMRIEPGAAGPVFNAYPAGRGPTAFPVLEQGELTITFANAAHDYPQRISYTRDGSRLSATIALIDGDRPGTWNYQRCR